MSSQIWDICFLPNWRDIFRARFQELGSSLSYQPQGSKQKEEHKTPHTQSIPTPDSSYVMRLSLEELSVKPALYPTDSQIDWAHMEHFQRPTEGWEDTKFF